MSKSEPSSHKGLGFLFIKKVVGSGGFTMSNTRKGRTSKVNNVLDELSNITKWTAEGFLQKDIYPKLGIAEATWNSYKNKYPEIKEAIKKGNEILIEQRLGDLEVSAVKVACGYEIEETKEVFDNNNDLIRKEITKKHVAPSATMLIFLLQNLAPKIYQDRRNNQVIDVGQAPKIVDDIS